MKKKEVLLIALGGNALLKKGQEGTATQQLENLKIPMRQIAKLSQKYKIILTHGNGPQVGNLLIQQERCNEVPKMPLEILVAQTQGQIGYMIESTLDTELMNLGIEYRPLISLISYVVVDENDPAFKNPTKPIGPIYAEQEIKNLPYPVYKTAKGYRRKAVSPKPVTIVEKREIKKLIEMDFIVICCGGGGIPVVRNGRTFSGVDAVIDKDLVSSKLAEEVGIDIFIIATDIEGVMINFKKPNQKLLKTINIDDAESYLNDGHFFSGSMGPKMQAVTQFVKNSKGKKAAITSINNIEKSIMGQAGTQILYK